MRETGARLVRRSGALVSLALAACVSVPVGPSEKLDTFGAAHEAAWIGSRAAPAGAGAGEPVRAMRPVWATDEELLDRVEARGSAITEGSDATCAYAWTPDGRRLMARLPSEKERALSANEARVWLREPEGHRPLGPLPGEPRSAAFAHDGRTLLTVHDGGLVRSWSVSLASEPVVEDELELEGARLVRAGRDRFVVKTASEVVVGAVDEDGDLELLGRWPGAGLTVLSPDGRLLLTTDDRAPRLVTRRGARLWRLVDADGQLERRPVALLGPGDVSSAAFSLDGAFVVARQADGWAWLWRLDPGGGLPWPADRLRISSVQEEQADEWMAGLPRDVVFDGADTLEFGAGAGWTTCGARRVRLGDETIDWDRPRDVPHGRARLVARTERRGRTLLVEVENLGEAPAFQVAGVLSYDHTGLPLGARTRFAVGTVRPGAVVRRTVDLPTYPDLALRSIDWSDRWGHAPAPLVLEAAPVDSSRTVRACLQDAARLLLDLGRGPDDRVLARVAAALRTDGDYASAEQLERNRTMEWGSLGFPIDRPGGLEATSDRAHVYALARAGRREEALALVTDGSTSPGAAALLDVALVEAEGGREGSARELARRAIQPAARVFGDAGFDPFAPKRWLLSLRGGQFGVFGVSSALRQAEQYEARVAAAARLCARLGLTDGEWSLAAFDGLATPNEVLVITAAQAQVLDPLAVRAWVDRLHDPEARANGLLGIGLALLPQAR